MPFTEQDYENSVIELFEKLEYLHMYGPEVEHDFRSPIIESAVKESLKRLSFSYRTVQNDELIAFIALKKEDCPFLKSISNACRILHFEVKKIKIQGWNMPYLGLYDKMFDEAMFYIKEWCEDGKPYFDCVWFAEDDIELIELKKLFKDFIVKNGIFYKSINRI